MFRDLCCVPCIEAGLGLRMIEEVYFHFALGILKTEEPNGTDVTGLAFFNTLDLSLECQQPFLVINLSCAEISATLGICIGKPCHGVSSAPLETVLYFI